MSSQVRSELERKKARLAALKEEKARKERLKLEQNENIPPILPGLVDIRHEADQILKSLNLNEEVQQLGVIPAEQSSVSPAAKNKNLTLCISQIEQTSIPPEAPMRYSKEIQTVESRDYINDTMNGGLHDEHDWSFDPSG
ncbi:Cytoplasmic dynein 1 intermediate chain 2 [Cichlidogyrus casuarinus]|uniref:Cytoplasmic dynein 1 intermediate chain 2 n=1 Tax=Cichlidogyrus casuarinus TaxID=1844966 RepID=A0ABD2QDG7_9PLAT